MDALDALQLRDQEINKALSLANEILNEEPKQNDKTEKDKIQSDEEMDTLIGTSALFLFSFHSFRPLLLVKVGNYSRLGF